MEEEKKKRQIFYSFHFAQDFWRTQQVRNIGVIEGDKPVSVNEWEEIKRKGDDSIKKWIEENLKYKSCIVVLVGTETANRKWVIYEIERAWNLEKGVVGIRIHNLKDQNGNTTYQGSNPFDNLTMSHDIKRLSALVKLYNPSTIYSSDYSLTESQAAYRNISDNIEKWIEEAIKIRNSF
jgi:hypothetical protein